jgi:hypothetical protein
MATVKLKHAAVIVVFTINSCLTITDNFAYITATGLPTLHSLQCFLHKSFSAHWQKKAWRGKTKKQGKSKKSDPIFGPLFHFDPKQFYHNTPTIKIRYVYYHGNLDSSYFHATEMSTKHKS